MKVSSPVVGVVLGLIAILLLGYAWYNERQTAEALQARVDDLQFEISDLRNTQESERDAIYAFLLSEEGISRINAIAAAPTRDVRQTLANGLSVDLIPYLIEYGAAEEIIVRLGFLVEEPDPEARAEIASLLIEKIGDMRPVVIVPPEPIFVGSEAAATISTLVAVAGSVGSMIGSAFVFLTGGRKRRMEEELMAVDLAKQKVELARMQYEAQDALAATQGRSVT